MADIAELPLSFEPSAKLAELSFIGQRTKDALGESSDLQVPTTDVTISASENATDAIGSLDMDSNTKPSKHICINLVVIYQD